MCVWGGGGGGKLILIAFPLSNFFCVWKYRQENCSWRFLTYLLRENNFLVSISIFSEHVSPSIPDIPDYLLIVLSLNRRRAFNFFYLYYSKCLSENLSGNYLYGNNSSQRCTGWGISRLTPLFPTNGMSYAPGSQYIVVGGKAVRNAWHGCHGRHLEGRQQAVRGIKGC